MNMKNLRLAVLCATCAVALAACGGGDGPDAAASIASTYGVPLSAMNSTASTNALQDAFASNYLDAGTTRAQVVDALAKDAAGFANGDYSAFPVASMSGVTISNCNINNVCTLSATLTNADADTTSVPFTTQVVIENGSFRLLGDQKSS